MKTINDSDFSIDSKDYEFNYQKRLTDKLDKHDNDFNQDTINEIVLWKVNRYAELSNETIDLINTIKDKFDLELTTKILKKILDEKGIQLPMASTILRFKNPNIYQIIDQRIYRLLYGNELKINAYKSDKNIDIQIELYLKYLNDLKVFCSDNRIMFKDADRILYNVDKRLNKDEKIKNY